MTTITSSKATAILKESFKEILPTGPQIAIEAVSSGLKGHETNQRWIKNNFSKLIESVQEYAYDLYLENERKAGSKALTELFIKATENKINPTDINSYYYKYFDSIDAFFLGIAQGRKARAGKMFEFLLKSLFTKLQYPFSEQQIINGKPDFVLPSIEHYKINPMDCIIFTAKRTLRERWRQIVTEGTRGLGFFLATIDEDVRQNDLNAMKESRIYLVVPSRLKNDIAAYNSSVNVISFEEFFASYLDPAMKRWKKSGILE